MKSSALSFVVALCLLALAHAAPQSDRITSLPNLSPPPNFDQYSGYITVNKTNGRALFYWFVEATSNSASAPIILWMNGGPGASSLYGLFRENGPFVVYPNQYVGYNAYSWNSFANLLYVESPAGVGFSYSNTTSDYDNQGDETTANDNLQFLLGFYNLFPEYKNNPLYIAGESYGGHYCPQLGTAVYQYNQNASPSTVINLHGLVVGNPWTDEFWDGTWSPPRYAYGRGLMSKATFDSLMTNCDNMFNTTSEACKKSHEQWIKEQGPDGAAESFGFNQLSLYEPCYRNPVDITAKREPIGCINCTALTEYLNSPKVQSAIHAQTHMGPWGAITKLDYDRSVASVVDLYPTLISKYRVMIYSGDSTTNCNFMGSDAWIESLGRPITRDWRPWHAEESGYGNQVGGWIKEYDLITLATIRGAGHMAPQYRPAFTHHLVSSFIESKPIN